MSMLQAAEAVGKSPSATRTLALKGLLKTEVVAGRVVVLRESVDEYLASREPATPAAISQTYVVTVRLSERGARELRHENGRNWMDGMEYEVELDADSIEDLEEAASEYGEMITHRVKGSPAPATRVSA